MIVYSRSFSNITLHLTRIVRFKLEPNQRHIFDSIKSWKLWQNNLLSEFLWDFSWKYWICFHYVPCFFFCFCFFVLLLLFYSQWFNPGLRLLYTSCLHLSPIRISTHPKSSIPVSYLFEAKWGSVPHCFARPSRHMLLNTSASFISLCAYGCLGPNFLSSLRLVSIQLSSYL